MTAAVPLVHTQMVPPRLKNYIKRHLLQPLGLSIRSHRVTTLTAPAGYGKSVWVASLLEESGWPPTAWLSLDRYDIETSFLLYHLIYSLKKSLPGYGNQSLRTINSLEDANRDWEIAVSSMLEELPEEKEIILVLDDFHLVDKNPTTCRIIEYMAQRLPEKAHLVIISRIDPPLNFYRLKLSGELLNIPGEKMLFSLEEAGELLRSLDLGLNENDLADIHSFTGGWAAGLRLIGLFLKQSGGDLKKSLASLSQRDADLYKYLSNEILAHLPREWYDFLLGSSLLPYLEPGLCRAALQCEDNDLKIMELHSNGILSRVEGDTTTWRLHHLMEEFLTEKARDELDPEYIDGIRRRAAAFLEEKGDIDRAIEQSAAGADWQNAVRLIVAHGEAHFIESGRQDALSSWISRLPEERLADDHQLLYYKGMACMHVEPTEALELLSRSADLARTRGDIAGQIRSLMAMLVIHTFTNETEKLVETASRIPVAASLLKDSWSRGVIIVAGLGRAVFEDELKRAALLSRMAGRMKLDPQWQLYYLLSSSILQYRLGNLAQARLTIEKALALPLVQNSDRWTGTVYEVLSGIYCDAGDCVKTVEISQELLRLGSKYNIPHQQAYGHRRLAQVHLRKGELVKARREYELSREYWIKAGNINMAEIADLEIILIRSSAGENPKNLLDEILNQLNEMLARTGYVFRDFALALAGIIAREAGELTLAQRWLEESAASSANKGAKHMLAGSLLHLAKLHLLKGEERKADNYLRRAMGIIETLELDVFWDWHAETVYHMCRRAVLKKIHPQWAVRILRKWFSEHLYKEAGVLLAHSDEGVRKIISELLQDEAQETGVSTIHVLCLGGFRVFVKGVEIPPTQWKTRKAENLFKYLIINRHHCLKERIIEELWPESDDRLGDASLRMALTHVRKSLGLDDGSGESVILRRKMIHFNPRIQVVTDYELFTVTAQNALLEAEAENPLAESLLSQAADLYRGDFMPDNLYDDWTANLRTQLQHLYAQVVLKQVEYYRRSGRLETAVQACRRYLALDPVNELMVRAAMELLWQQGQKQPALSLYRRLVSVLKKEYDMDPAAATQELYERLRRG